MEIGDLGTWVSGLVGLLGLYALYSAHRLSQQMRTDERARDQRQQALAISSWVSLMYVPDEYRTRVGEALFINNNSQSAIYDVQVTVLVAEGKTSIFRAVVCPPGEYYATYTAKTSSGFDWGFIDDARGTTLSRRPFSSQQFWRVIYMQFTDGSGNVWRRSEVGALEALQLAEI